ncbi:alpha/beta hydrolase [Marinomonas mediterranea]|uniref:COG3904 family protein n=1 Tax=Marinomonas mediterranea TaxID=119864 RepID=UPI00234AFC13|nr:alpha/beta hydrolase [Marinomonas mediterranea]WCN10593.1 alpha/beta hydrolase [Marinomonas mediterranea]WCN14644.1 alpha/beta hydrolase [Marinomonas mediterranea]
MQRYKGTWPVLDSGCVLDSWSAIGRWPVALLVIVSLAGCASSSSKNREDGAAKASVIDTDSNIQLVVNEDSAYLSGVLGRELTNTLKSMIEQHPNVTELVLVDVPGSLDQQETMNSARLIRRLGLNTHIARTGYVLSGGVDLFLGGVKRTIGPGSAVGVHAWRDQDNPSSNAGTIMKGEVDMADPVHAEYVNFYLSLGIPERFYWFSLNAAPAERIYYLTSEEIYDFHLATD